MHGQHVIIITKDRSKNDTRMDFLRPGGQYLIFMKLYLLLLDICLAEWNFSSYYQLDTHVIAKMYNLFYNIRGLHVDSIGLCLDAI